jgi:hypothetical protein
VAILRPVNPNARRVASILLRENSLIRQARAPRPCLLTTTVATPTVFGHKVLRSALPPLLRRLVLALERGSGIEASDRGNIRRS